jgi:hypothetical protein
MCLSAGHNSHCAATDDGPTSSRLYDTEVVASDHASLQSTCGTTPCCKSNSIRSRVVTGASAASATQKRGLCASRLAARWSCWPTHVSPHISPACPRPGYDQETSRPRRGPPRTRNTCTPTSRAKRHTQVPPRRATKHSSISGAARRPRLPPCGGQCLSGREPHKAQREHFRRHLGSVSEVLSPMLRLCLTNTCWSSGAGPAWTN